MNTYRLLFSSLLAVSLLLFSCGEGKNKKAEEEEAPKEVARSGRTLVLEEVGLASPESVLRHGDTYYVSNLGKKVLPSEKDGDGFIMTFNNAGEVLAEKWAEGLDAPKGLEVIGNTLYVTDIDKVKGFDLSSGELVKEIDMSKTGTSFLNDLETRSETQLFVSATDINRIFLINLEDDSYEELVTKPTVQGPNGLAFDRPQKRLYVASYPGNGKGNLGVVKVALEGDSPYTAFTSYEGALDGLGVIGSQAFVSDWNRGAMIVMNLDNVSQVGLFPMMNLPAEGEEAKSIEGPADFFIDTEAGEIWLPAMKESKIYIRTL